MPKLSNRPPKYSKLKQYAVVYYRGKIHYMGLCGSEESKVAYTRFIAEYQSNPLLFMPKAEEDAGVTISELVAAFLDHVSPTLDASCFGHYRVIVGDFLLKLYGDNFSADDFKPSCLKLVRSEMIQSRRFFRNTINKYVRRIITIFTWGVEEELVQPSTPLALKAVKSLVKGYAGTFENKVREPVADEVIIKPLCRSWFQLLP